VTTLGVVFLVLFVLAAIIVGADAYMQGREDAEARRQRGLHIAWNAALEDDRQATEQGESARAKGARSADPTSASRAEGAPVQLGRVLPIRGGGR
jgi:hypothetical protein